MKHPSRTILSILPLLSIGASQTPDRPAVKLVTETPVSQNLIEMSEGKTSIGGVVYHGYINTVGSFAATPSFGVFYLGKKAGLFRCVVGIRDSDPFQSGSYRILVDGELVDKGTVTPKTPKHLSVDVERASSLKIEIRDCSIGEPLVDWPGPDGESSVRLIAPEDGEKVSGKALLRWSSIPDAVSYGVEIVCVSASGDADADDADRIWAYSVKGGKTSVSVDTAALPTGRYRWSVVGFGKKKVLGSFSKEKYFTVSN